MGPSRRKVDTERDSVTNFSGKTVFFPPFLSHTEYLILNIQLGLRFELGFLLLVIFLDYVDYAIADYFHVISNYILKLSFFIILLFELFNIFFIF